MTDYREILEAIDAAPDPAAALEALILQERVEAVAKVKQELDLSFFYRRMRRGVLGNGTVHFDSDAMDENEPWVQYFALLAAKTVQEHES